jgi:hypothetical protein
MKRKNETSPTAGIDYSLGQSNVNTDTGIHYGVISPHNLSSWVEGEAEPVYPDSVKIECEHCGEFFDTDNLCPDDYQDCPECGKQFRARDLDNLEPIGWDYGQSEYTTESSDLGIYIIKSPYYTRCKFCSPCCPGAGDLNSPTDGGVKTYCFRYDMFDADNPCPYPVYNVSDDSLVPVPADDAD